MTNRSVKVEGQYYDGRFPIAVPATLAFEDGETTLTTVQTVARYAAHSLKASPRVGIADRFVALPGGGQFQCADHGFLDSLPQDSPSEGPVAWLEERWPIALAGVAVIVSVVLAGYFFGLPFAAERVASRIPIETERALGGQALTWLDNKWLQPTVLDQAEQKKITDGFNELCGSLPLSGYYRLEFRSSTVVGPNAIALPGGTIVITDGMVDAAESQEELLAVLAHEVGHVELRHSLRSVLQGSAVAVVATTVTADAASLSIAVAGLPALLAQTRYSREFETAADDYAFKLLKQRGHSPEAFASIMERLSERNKENERSFAYVSTHPVTADRIKRARAEAHR